jgi:hypothetical protein
LMRRFFTRSHTRSRGLAKRVTHRTPVGTASVPKATSGKSHALAAPARHESGDEDHRPPRWSLGSKKDHPAA